MRWFLNVMMVGGGLVGMAGWACGQDAGWTAPPAATAQGAKAAPPASEFLVRWGQMAVGLRPDPADPASLPPEQQLVWRAIVENQDPHNSEVQLAAMTQLAQAYAEAPQRLDMLSQRAVGKPFGTWMAEVRWQTIRGHCRLGHFELSDVTAVEKPALIGILRLETQAAVEPISSFMPKPGIPVPDPGNAGGGIETVTVSNAIDLRPKAAYASAMLQAQLKLEPDMPGIDRVFLSRQLYAARRVFYRAMELEGPAKALLERQRELQRIQEEKARRATSRGH